MSCLLSLIKKSDTRSPIRKRKRERMKNEMKHGEVELFHYTPLHVQTIFTSSKTNEFLLVKMPTNVGITTFIGI